MVIGRVADIMRILIVNCELSIVNGGFEVLLKFGGNSFCQGIFNKRFKGQAVEFFF